MPEIQVSSNSFRDILLLVIISAAIGYLYYEIMKIKNLNVTLEEKISNINDNLLEIKELQFKNSRVDNESNNKNDVIEENKKIIYYENNDSTLTEKDYKIINKMDVSLKDKNENIKDVIYHNYNDKDNNINQRIKDFDNEELVDFKDITKDIKDSSISDSDLNEEQDKSEDDELDKEQDNSEDDYMEQDNPKQDDSEDNAPDEAQNDSDDEMKNEEMKYLQNPLLSISDFDTQPVNMNQYDIPSINSPVKNSEKSEVSDNESEPDYTNMTVKELREVLQLMELPVSGNKETLINRIKNN